MHHTRLNSNKSLLENLKWKCFSRYIIRVLLQDSKRKNNEIIYQFAREQIHLQCDNLQNIINRIYQFPLRCLLSGILMIVDFCHFNVKWIATWNRDPAMNQTVSSSPYSLLIPSALSRTSAWLIHQWEQQNIWTLKNFQNLIDSCKSWKQHSKSYWNSRVPLWDFLWDIPAQLPTIGEEIPQQVVHVLVDDQAL